MMLLNNKSLNALTLCGLQLPGKVVEMIFTSLQTNTQLTSLSLVECSGDDWPTATFVLDSLRINGILADLDLRGTPLEGKSARAIEAQLARNGENAKQLKVLKSQGSAEVAPTSVRLFLCGLPFSGKTTIARSLVNWSTTQGFTCSSITNCFSCVKSKVIERTRGIQVTSIAKDGISMSLWDLAGQSEYFAFHDYMFPNLSNEAIPSMFLFVWNPIEVHEKTGRESTDEDGRIKQKSVEMFKDELKYWLRFVASKSLKSVKFRPLLFVAITREDRLPAGGNNIRRWIESTFNQCQEEFKAHIQIDMQEGFFTMDARDSDKVQDLAIHLFKFAKNVLEIAPRTYQACDLVRTLFARIRRMDPIISKEHFFSLCKKKLGIDSKDMQESIALSLSDSGDIIYFKSFDLVVIDTQWFCHDIMGDFLSFSSKSFQSARGSFAREVLENLLESKVKSTSRTISRESIRNVFAKPSKSPKIKGEALVKLLIGLRLAFQPDEVSEIFVPACLPMGSRRQIHPSDYFQGDREKSVTFMGRRLNCKDSIRTFFTPGIFSFLQIALENTFHDLKVKVTLEDRVIFLAYQGFKVFIEACGKQGQDHFIDVLISSPDRGMDGILEWGHENILNKVEKICADPRGIQGVELRHEVIRPADLDPDLCSGERTQSVPVEDLKSILEEHLEKKGYQLKGEDAIQNVRYTWQQTSDSSPVAALLGERETLLVVESCLQGLNVAAQDALGIDMEGKPKMETYSMEEGETSQVTENPLPINVEQEPGCSSKKPVFRSPTFRKLEQVHKDMKIMHKDMRIMHEDLRNMGDNLLNEFKNTRDLVLERLIELLTVVQEGEAGKLPRMYVVNRDDGKLVHKMAAAIVPSLHNMRLKLLCEHKSRPHLVEGKPGLSLTTLDDGLLKKALPYVKAFLKVARIAVKVGAHVAAGIGNDIPDFKHVLPLIIDSDAVLTKLTISEPTGEPLSDFTSPAYRANYDEGRQWLCDVLSNNDCRTSAKIHEVFGLNRVQYRESKAVAWVCDGHISDGYPMPL